MNLSFWPMLLLTAIGFICLVVVLIVVSHPDQRLSSISRYIARDRWLHIIMAILLMVCGVIFYGFTTQWLRPAYNLPSGTNFLAIVSLLALFGLAILPDIDTKIGQITYHQLHFFCGGTLGVTYIALLLLCVTQSLQLISLIFTVAALVFCSLCYPLFFVTQYLRKYFFQFETTAISLFLIAITCLALEI